MKWYDTCCSRTPTHTHLYNQPYVHIYCLDEIHVSLVVTSASVAPQVLCLTPRGREYSRIYQGRAFSDMRRFRRQRDVCGDFVNLKDLLTQSSKILVGVVFFLHIFIGVSVSALYAVILKKNMLSTGYVHYIPYLHIEHLLE